jgi:hypothetical protein
MEKSDLIIRKSFSAPHNNGEIWAENLDSLYDFSEIVEGKFMEDLKIIRRPSSPSAIAVNLNQTVVTQSLITVILEGLISVGKVRKVAFVGLNKESIHMIKRLSKQYKLDFGYQCFSDFVKAKNWIIP